jgi:hypothetical protein
MSLYFTFYITVDQLHCVFVKYFVVLFVNPHWSTIRCSPHILILVTSNKIPFLQLADVFVFVRSFSGYVFMPCCLVPSL